MKKIYYFSILALFPLLTACPVKNTPRQTHEGKREWQPAQTPVDQSVEAKSFSAFDVHGAYAALSGGGSMMEKVLKPLADFVLNGKFIERADFRTPRMTQMIQIFNTAFLMQLDANDRSAEFLELKDRYYKTVFAGCSRDLKTDCYNADLFSADTRHTRIMTKMARELDAVLDAQIKAFGPEKCVETSDDCRRVLEDRYRLLAMGAYKRNRYDDSEYAFAYLKYARMFGQMVEFSQLRSSYLAETHAQIFDVLIAKYQPRDLKDPEFRAFVENFNPWTYSNKTADMFKRGTGVMFGYATRCCLYKDETKTGLSEAVVKAIAQSQLEKDSFREMVLKIKAAHSDRLFKNLGINDLALLIEAHDPRFFNEVFFVVDRLYRGHLNTAEVEMVLSNANYARVQKELPKMVSAYLRIQLAYMVLETNLFMARLYDPKTNIGSDRIFHEAVVSSRELSNRWQAIQAQADLLDRMMGSYFKSRFPSSEYYETNRMIKAINRNIYYMAGFPNMIVMNYFLSKLKGKIVISSWWGSFEIDADKILDAFFDGQIESPWFRFGKDPEMLSRPMLLYSFEYLLSTEALDSFVAKDATATGGSDRAKFLDLIFTKYLDDNLDDLRTKITAYGRETWGDSRAVSMNEICNYETGRSHREPRPEINFMDLNRFTYSGIGDNGAHAVLSGLVTKSAGIIGTLRDKTEYRMSLMLVMLDILEADLIRTGKITHAGQAHPDTARIRANIADLEDIRRQVARLFLDQHEHYHKCLLTLREVERRRANRLYDEERAHLRQIYRLMKPLSEITDPAQLNAKVAELNTQLAQSAKAGQNAYLPADLPYDFDRIDGLTFKMSKYNLLMRMKKRVEGDIFMRPTQEETGTYDTKLAEFKPRAVTVYRPDGLVRDEMVAKGTAITLYLRGTEEDFVRQGMVALNGKSGSFLDWRTQLATINSPMEYTKSLMEFYLLGGIAKGQAGQTWEVTKEQLTDAYIKAVASDTMDLFDIRNAQDFGTDGLQAKSYFEGKLFEKDFVTRLPLFYYLMKETYATAEIHMETGPMYEALQFAQAINNLQAFVFEPSGTIPQSVRKVYGDRAHHRLNRVNDLFNHLAKLESDGNDAAALDPRLARPLYLSGDDAVAWYNRGTPNLVDRQKRDDLKSLVRDFTSRTGNFFQTREKVKVQ